MKYLSYLILLILSSNYFVGQTNLVPNSSFESHVNCDVPNMNVNNWFPCGGTPDYYNSCATSTASGYPSFSVPSNWLGYQNAYEGNAYMGLIIYSQPYMPNREYIGVLLTQPLSIGTKYFLSAYISHADSSMYLWYRCATNNFGFKFTSSATGYSFSNPAPTNNFSHFHSNTVIYDTLGWTKISGSFIADSSYKYCIIGNFYDNLNTNNSNCINYPQMEAYYFVDNVCISVDSNFCNLATNINSIDILKTKIYPNPSSDNFFVKLPIQSNIIKVNFYNSFGQIISVKTIRDNSEIDLNFIDDGVYTVEIICERNTFYDKIVVRH